MKHTTLIAIACIVMFCSLLRGDDGMNDALKRNIASTNDQVVARNAVITAFNNQKVDVLLAAMDNPNFDIQATAVMAIGNLPKPMARNALVQILQTDHLWREKIPRGRGGNAQMNFVQALLDAISRNFSLDSLKVDLFDNEERTALINKLRK